MRYMPFRGLLPESLSAVSGAPARTVRVRMRFARALLIQRLEGSRPQGSLCILNGVEGGRCVDELVVICTDRRLDVGTKLGAVAWRGRLVAGEIGGGAIRAI